MKKQIELIKEISVIETTDLYYICYIPSIDAYYQSKIIGGIDEVNRKGLAFIQMHTKFILIQNINYN